MTLRYGFQRAALRPAFVLILALFCLAPDSFAQLSGTKTIDPGGSGVNNYTTFSAAINDLNTNGVGAGGVTFNVAPGITFTETLPALTATGTSANPIVFQKGASGSNPIIVPATGGSKIPGPFGNMQDAIFRIVGTDYLTIDGIDLADDTVSFTTFATRYEFGYLLLKASVTNACQYVTIRNCNVRLSRTSDRSIGIYVSNMLPAWSSLTSDTAVGGITVTAVTGRSEAIKIYNNTISHCQVPIYVRGYAHGTTPYHLFDHFIEIGKDGGNTLSNYGFASFNACYGIYTIYQDSMHVANNSITNGAGSTTTTTGILTSTAASASVDIYNNTITLTGSATTSQLTGISNGAGSTAALNLVRIYGNTVTGCTYPTATSGAFKGIEQTATAKKVFIYQNNIYSNTLPGTGVMHGIHNSAAMANTDTLRIYSNNVYSQSKTGASGTGAMYGIQASTALVEFYDNSIHDLTCASGQTGTMYGYYNGGAPLTETYTNNTVYNLTHNGSGTLYGMSITTSTGTKNTSVNQIYGLTSGGTVYGYASGYGTVHNVFRNRIHDLTTTGSSATVNGIYLSTSASNVSNNFISDLQATTSTSATAVSGIWIYGGTAANLYYNTVYLDAVSSSATTFGSSAVYINTTPTVEMRNNIFANNSTAGPTGGFTVAYRRTSTTLTSYASGSNNNCFYGGATPAANYLIFYDGTNSDQTMAAYKTRVSTRDASSFRELPPFLNTGATPYDLHLDTSTPTQCESGGTSVTGYLVDYDNDARFGSGSYTGLGSAPDVGADEGDFTVLDLIGPSISYTTLGNGPLAGTRSFQNVTISDASGVNTTSGTNPRVYYKKGSLYNEWNDNTSATNGWKWVETASTSNPYSFTIDYSKLPTALALGDTVYYFVVAQDNAGTPNVGINSGSFASTPSSVALTAPAFPIGGTLNKYFIAGSVQDTISVGVGGRLAKLKTAFDFINSSVITGDVIVRVVGNTVEDTMATLNALAVDPSTAQYGVRVVPVGNVTVASNNTTPAVFNGAALIRLFDADRICIDGINSGGNSLTLQVNDTTKTTAVVWFSSNGNSLGASSDTVKNCSIIGALRQNVGSTNTFGVLLAGTSVTTGSTGADNDNNVISGNTFKRLRYGVYTYGAAAPNVNNNTTITGNIIGPAAWGEDQIGKGGIVIANDSAATITDNEIRYVGGLIGDVPSGTDRAGISLATDAAWTPTTVYVRDAKVLRNNIHDIIDQKNSLSAVGIVVAGVDGTNLTSNIIANNMISNVFANGTSPDRALGIGIGSGNGDYIVYNSISMVGDLDPTGTGTTTMSAHGIFVNTTSATNLTIKNNNVAVDLTCNTTTIYHSPIYIPSAHPWGTGGLDYNNWYYPLTNTQGRTGSIAGTYYTTMATWRTAATRDSNSVEVNPMFTSATDLHVSSGTSRTSLESGGTAIAAVTTDYDGQTRPGGGGTSNGGGTAPDIGADEFDGVPEVNMYYISSTTTQLSTLPVFPNTTPNQIIGVQVVTAGNKIPMKAKRFYFTNTSTSAADVSNAKLYYTGTSPVFATTTQFGSTVAVPGSAFSMTDTTKNLAVGTNYFWLTYDIVNGATIGNQVDARCDSLNVADTLRIPSVTDPAGTRTITGPIAGTYTVGTGGTYPKLSDAFAAANLAGLAGDVRFEIISDISETVSASLNQWNEFPPASNFSITVVPSGGSWTVSGPIAGGALVKLNGADRVRIDGLNSGGNALTLRNTDSSGTDAVVWLSSVGAGQGATRDTLMNLTIIGGGSPVTNSSVTFGIYNGGSSISATTVGNDNDYNVITNNTITRVRYGIATVGGSAANPNFGTKITNNIVGPASYGVDMIGKCGILASNEEDLVVTGNEVRFIGNRIGDTPSGTDLVGISLSSDAAWTATSTYLKNATVSRNMVHDIAEEKTFSGVGILLAGVNGSIASSNTVANNMIYNVLANGTGSDQALGIGIAAGFGDRIVYNSIRLSGDADPTGASANSVSSYGISVYSTAILNPTIRNNVVYTDVTSNTGTLYHGAIYLPASYSFGSGVMDNNDWYYVASNTQARLGAVSTTYYTAMSAWRGATLQDAASLNVDPSFTSATDLHIGSGATPNALESSAVAIAGLTTDYDGQTRPGGGGTSNGGGTAPDMGADEFDGAPADLVAPAITYTPLTNSASTTSRTVSSFATITDASGVNTTSGTRPRLYYKKGGTTNWNSYTDNTSASAGWKYVEASNTTSPFSFTIDYSLLPLGVVSGDTIQYFVVAQDNAATPNVGMLSGVFAAAPSSVDVGSAGFPLSGTINSYKIVTATISGNVTVGPLGTYTSLTKTGGLFADINSKVVTGDITVTIIDSLNEDGTFALNQWAEDPPNSNFTITIVPDGTVERTIYGAAAISLIRLDGADRVTIDGRYSGSGRYLRIVNNVTGNPSFAFVNDASNNVVRNCIFEGANTIAASGVMIVTVSTVNGNDNNVITDNLFSGMRYTSGRPATMLYSGNSTAGAPSNSDCRVTKNEFRNFTNYGVYLTTSRTGSNWVVDSNMFYQTETRSTQLNAIYCDQGDGHSFRYNSIGGSDAVRGGAAMTTTYATTPAFQGIYFAGPLGATNTISNNIIGNVTTSAAGQYNIYATSGNLNITDNRIGSNTAGSDTLFASTSTTYGVYYSGNGTVTVDNDTVGYIQSNNVVYPIYIPGGTATITDNIVNHVAAGSTLYGLYYAGNNSATISGNTLSGLTGAATTLAGIYFSSSGGNNTLSNNSVSGLYNTSTQYGMYHSGTLANATISNNTVSGNTGASSMYGILVGVTGTVSVTNNTVTGFTNNGVSSGIYGLYVQSTLQPATVSNNTVSQLTNNSFQGSIQGMTISSAGTNTVTSNTVGNLTSTRKGNVYMLYLAGGINSASNNIVHTGSTAADSVLNTFSLLGFLVTSSAAGQNVYQNTVFNLTNTSANDSATVVGGIYVSTTPGAQIRRNKVWDISSTGAGLQYRTARLYGIYAQSSGAVVYSNNMVAVGDSIGARVNFSAAEDVDSVTTSEWYYNSFYVTGNNPGTDTTNTYAFNRRAQSTITFRNNLCYNGRTGGTGKHYAIGNTRATYLTNWNPTNVDYNLLVTTDSGTVGDWGPWGYPYSGKALSAWKDSAGGAFTYYATTSQLPSSIFTDPNNANLSVDGTNAASWYMNGNGIAGSASNNIADDYAATSVRSTTLGVGTDIGADEFTASAAPPSLIETGSLAAGQMSYYWFGGRKVAEILWGTGGTLPSAVTGQYYPGVNPPSPLQGQYANAYWNFTATGGSGFTYDMTLFYTPAIWGTLGTEANARLAKRDGGVWTHYPTSTVNTTVKSVTEAGLASFSDFTISDNTNPLPVELVSFRARLLANAVRLDWRTASELNSYRYYIERRGIAGWDEIGFVDARGSVDTPSDYTFTDDRLPAAKEYVYRLRMTDRDGSFSYSNEVRVSTSIAGFELFGNYPNPFNPQTAITFALPTDEHVVISVFDANGREVAMVHSGALPAGTHSFTFTARNLPSGVYRYTVTAGAQMRVGSMVLAR
ncbi:MAG: right-handed parallel beta-helix repeat-containing protein [Ignavibacteriae bacterium]|nr:right-handed parallel beta-helix repeat-containing protein [Ignavibacteriota bacterium]